MAHRYSSKHFQIANPEQRFLLFPLDSPVLLFPGFIHLCSHKSLSSFSTTACCLPTVNIRYKITPIIPVLLS